MSSRGGGGGHRGVVDTHVVGGIDSLHAVTVAGGDGEARIAEGGAGGRGDLHKGGAARALTALDSITGDAHVVGGGGPAEIDLGWTHGRGGEAGDITRGRRVGPGWCDGRGLIRLNLGQRQHAAVEADFVEHAAERIIPLQVADRHDVARAIGFQGLRRRGPQDSIDIDVDEVRRVREGHGHMVPIRIGDRAGDGVAGAEGAEGQLVIGIKIELLTARHPGGGTLAEEMALSSAQHVAFHPQLNREIGRAEVVGAGVRHRDGIIDTVEGQGRPIGGLAGDPGGPIDQGAGVPAPRGISQRRPASFVHAVGGHKGGDDQRRTRDGVRVVDAHIIRGIDGLHAVTVARAGGQARIVVAGGAGGGDLRKDGTAGSLTALHAIADDAHIVGGGGPKQIDLTAAGRRGGESGHIARGNRIRCREGGGAGHCGVVHTHVVGRINGFHAIVIGGGGGQACVDIRHREWRGDLRKGGTAYALAALHAIADHPDIIGRRRPAEVDLGGTDDRGGQACHIARGCRVGPGRRDGRGHIRLNLGERQRLAVETDFVE